jgi:hypothetical protein
VDFLLSRGADLEAHADVLNTVTLDQTQPPTMHRVGPVEVLTSSVPPTTADGSVFLFDGQVAWGGRIYHPLLSGASDLPQLVDEVLDRGVHRVEGGVYCIARVRSVGAEVSVDPLGQYPVYWTRWPTGWAVSNYVPLIHALLVRQRLPVTRSLAPCVENMFIGGVLGDKTHVEQVSRLPQGHRLVGGTDLRVLTASDPIEDVDYADALAAAHASISRHVEAVDSSVTHRGSTILDLTGGRDSRAVLSFVNKSGLLSDRAGRSLTRIPHPDARVASMLMEHYGIPFARTPKPATVASPFVDELAVRQNAAMWGGARDTGSAVPTVAFSDVVHLKGSFGELGGAAAADLVAEVSARGPYSPAGVADLVIERKGRTRAIELLTRAAVAHGRAAVIDHYARLEDAYPRAHLTAESYLHSRSRTHFGLASWIENKTRILPDVLANRWLVAARRALPPSLHMPNKVIFDLMMRNDPELVFLPMAKPWDASIVPPNLHGRLQHMHLVDRETPDVVRWDRPLFTAVHLDDHPVLGFEPLTSGAPQQVTSLSPLHASIGAYQALLLFLHESAPADSRVWDWFDRTVVLEYVGRSPDHFHPDGHDIGAMGRAAAGMMWQLGHEFGSQVRSVRPFAASRVE